LTTSDAGSRTPILDRLEPLPPLRAPRGLAPGGSTPIIVGVVIGVLLSFGGVRAWLAPVARFFGGLLSSIYEVDFLVLVPVAVASLFVAIVIHEAGHAIGGWLAGFRVHSIRVWRIQLEPPFKVSTFRGASGGPSGWILATPGTTDRLAVRAGVMLFAGPAANLLTAAILHAADPVSVSGAGTFLRALMLWSVLLGAINLLPLRTGPFFSDGHRLMILLFDRARGERWLALLKLSKDVFDGLDPQYLSDEFLDVATAVKDESSDTLSAHAIAYSAAFSRGDNENAALHLETSLRFSARSSPGYQQALMADAAVFQGRRRGRADLAQAWLENMPAKVEVPWHRLWAEAGVLEARGARDEVAAKLNEVEGMIRAQAPPFERFLMAAVDRWRSDLQIPPST
jgi:hypothetical protein